MFCSPGNCCRNGNELNQILPGTPTIVSHLPHPGKVIQGDRTQKMLALGLFDMTGGLENSSEPGSSAEASAEFPAEGLPAAWLGSITSVSFAGLPCASFALFS